MGPDSGRKSSTADPDPDRQDRAGRTLDRWVADAVDLIVDRIWSFCHVSEHTSLQRNGIQGRELARLFMLNPFVGCKRPILIGVSDAAVW